MSAAEIREAEAEITRTVRELNRIYKTLGLRRRVEARYIKLARSQEALKDE